jgi:hypothetical protein
MPVFNILTDLKEVQQSLAGEDSDLIEYTAKWKEEALQAALEKINSRKINEP